ncbi:MAG: excinuclease ABC subunit UvrC [Thermoplasmata archaeon]|nr:excinuclease ABC subunit UvrC [Thermoplasmata archaeon]
MSDPVPERLPGFTPASQLAALESAPFRRGPTGPGVYLFRNGRGDVVYVGKALSLRRRVLDHLHVRVEKDGAILAQSSSVEFVPTVSEREALLLESNLVKQYQPPLNTLLKDDRSFPYLGVTLGDTWPRIRFLRRPKRGGGTVLFGPYTSAREAREVQKLLSETFQIRQCIVLPKRACLYYHIKTCSAPCIGAVQPEEYDRSVRQALRVLRGDAAGVRPGVERAMEVAAREEEYERAGHLRDALRGLDALAQRQHVIGPGPGRADVLSLAFPRDPAVLRVAVGLITVQDGEVRHTEPHLMATPADDLPDAGELLRQFLLQWYGARTEMPSRLYIAGPRPAGVDEAVSWLEKERGVRVRFRPTGRWASLARLAERLARSHLDAHAPAAPPKAVLEALSSLLKLPTLPRRIEGIDISILQGTEAVGSLVVFQNGAPFKEEYRRFKIRTVPGMNDFAMVAEVVRRRYRRRLAEEEILPDLLLIDGGRGQLASAESELAALHLEERVPAIGLAKREEEVYLPGEPIPLRPNPDSPPMLLLRAVRDEAHRFAVTYHRRRRAMRLREEVERAAGAPSRPVPPASG